MSLFCWNACFANTADGDGNQFANNTNSSSLQNITQNSKDALLCVLIPFIYFGLFMLNDCLEVEEKSLSSSQRCLSVCQIKVRVLNSSLYEKGEEQSRSEEKKRDVRVYTVCRGGRCVRCGAVGLEIIALTILARRRKKRTKLMSRARLTCSPPTRVTFAREA